MPHIWVEVEESGNCPYSPLQTFEVKGPEGLASRLLLIDAFPRRGPCEVVGWTTEDGGRVSDVRFVLVGDSGAGTSLLIAGGDGGIRVRPAWSPSVWSLDSQDQWGEPYLLLDPAVDIKIEA